ncbi:uncharacterized protein LOC131621467 [Vicia villosa]|uniref:uncharacterized protein LOC131621467 n=1 Tax=Vicia villosa TaxID=3911 RepID=UPI00273A9AC8|nr:uncharacterized protein LOC131621467 [Vicia villosa]
MLSAFLTERLLMMFRYKIEIEVTHGGQSCNFVFWNRECEMLLGLSASQLRNTMIQAGITDPLDFPLALDQLLKLEMAMKVKWHPRWKNCSVVMIIKNDPIIQQLKEKWGTDEEPIPIQTVVPETLEIKESVDEAKTDGNEDCELVTDLEITSEHKPDAVTPGGKRHLPVASSESIDLDGLHDGELYNNDVAKNGLFGLALSKLSVITFIMLIQYYGTDFILTKSIKVGTPIMLMRNIDQAEGLCNDTRLCITKMAAHVLEASIMGGKGLGNLVYIPRMDMSPSQSPWPFKLNRRQFPIIVPYSMTINKSQGQSLDNVGLYLLKDVFTHGQIYVALSRVTTKKGIKILIHDEEKKFREKTTNVVYKEVFNNV